MSINIQKALINEKFNPIGRLSNSDFNDITNHKSVGHYQFHYLGGHFTFREQENIHILQKITIGDFAEKLVEKIKQYSCSTKISIEKKNDYYQLFFYDIEGDKYSFSKGASSIFELLLSFYEYSKSEFYLEEAQ